MQVAGRVELVAIVGVPCRILGHVVIRVRSSCECFVALGRRCREDSAGRVVEHGGVHH